MPDCFLTVLKIHIDEVLKKVYCIVYILYSGIMEHNTLFKYKATNILESNPTLDYHSKPRASFKLFDFIQSAVRIY